MHCVMYKCFIVKVGGKRETQKVCKKHVNFTKSGRKFLEVGGNKKNYEIRWKCTETAKIGGNFKSVVEDFKKVSRNFGG